MVSRGRGSGGCRSPVRVLPCRFDPKYALKVASCSETAHKHQSTSGSVSDVQLSAARSASACLCRASAIESAAPSLSRWATVFWLVSCKCSGPVRSCFLSLARSEAICCSTTRTDEGSVDLRGSNRKRCSIPWRHTTRFDVSTGPKPGTADTAATVTSAAVSIPYDCNVAARSEPIPAIRDCQIRCRSRNILRWICWTWNESCPSICCRRASKPRYSSRHRRNSATFVRNTCSLAST